MNDSVTPTKPKKNPYTPWIVVISFVAPVVLAYSLYFLKIAPPSFSNRGELLHPVIDVESLLLNNEKGEILDREAVTEHKWQMIYFAGAVCDETCNRVLYNTRQVNIAAGKNAYRLSRLLVHLDVTSPEFQALIDREYPNARHVNADRQTVISALRTANPDLEANEIYLMDPLGNIMMRFSDDQPPDDLLHDLKKLFKVSQIG